jgi:hypothetical protein
MRHVCDLQSLLIVVDECGINLSEYFDVERNNGGRHRRRGLPANRSVTVLARLFRCASSRSRSANSVSVQHGASWAKAFTQKAMENATRRKFTSPGLSHCSTTVCPGLRLRRADLYLRRCLQPGKAPRERNA